MERLDDYEPMRADPSSIVKSSALWTDGRILYRFRYAQEGSPQYIGVRPTDITPVPDGPLDDVFIALIRISD
jgi:hypothetical protein